MPSLRRRSKRSNKRTRVIRRRRLSVRKRGGGLGLTNEEVCNKQKKAVSDYLDDNNIDYNKKVAVLEHLSNKKNCSDIALTGPKIYVDTVIERIPPPQDTASL
jgi:hypothetical protein